MKHSETAADLGGVRVLAPAMVVAISVPPTPAGAVLIETSERRGVCTINSTIVVTNIPTDTLEAGTMYMGDVQYAVWDAKQASKSLIRYDPAPHDNPAFIVPSLKTIQFNTTRIRPAILVRFRLTKYGRPF